MRRHIRANVRDDGVWKEANEKTRSIIERLKEWHSADSQQSELGQKFRGTISSAPVNSVHFLPGQGYQDPRYRISSDIQAEPPMNVQEPPRAADGKPASFYGE